MNDPATTGDPVAPSESQRDSVTVAQSPGATADPLAGARSGADAAGPSAAAHPSIDHLLPPPEHLARQRSVAGLAFNCIEDGLNSTPEPKNLHELTRALGELRSQEYEGIRAFSTLHVAFHRAEALRRAADLREQMARRSPTRARRGTGAARRAAPFHADEVGSAASAAPAVPAPDADGDLEDAPRQQFNREHLRAAVREIYGLNIDDWFTTPLQPLPAPEQPAASDAEDLLPDANTPDASPPLANTVEISSPTASAAHVTPPPAEPDAPDVYLSVNSDARLPGLARPPYQRRQPHRPPPPPVHVPGPTAHAWILGGRDSQLCRNALSNCDRRRRIVVEIRKKVGCHADATPAIPRA